MAEPQDLDFIEACVQAIDDHERTRTIGRPSAMAPHKVRKFLQALTRGNFPEPASYSAGLSYRTVRRWLEDGEKDETESTPQFWFWQAAMIAQASDEDDSVSRLKQVAVNNPRFYMADLIRLSRRYRERWAERTADELRQAQAPTIQVLIGIAPPGTPQNPVHIQTQVIQALPVENPHDSR